MNKHVREHLDWLEARAFDISDGVQRKPKARDIEEAKAELRRLRAIIRQLRK